MQSYTYKYEKNRYRNRLKLIELVGGIVDRRASTHYVGGRFLNSIVNYSLDIVGWPQTT